ncbi:MAG: MFS transporter [Nocardioides sp.]|nr:MFS transporter [Nocardioides sp.]
MTDRKWWTLGVVCAATFMLLLDVTIVVVALPDIRTDLHAGLSDVQWVTDAYALTLASLLLTSGALADRYGRKRLFLGGLVVFTLGALACALASSPVALIVSRAAQGVGGAVLFSTALALLAATFHGRQRGVAFGVWGAVTGLATALGPVLGGVITTGFDWRGVFWVNLPIGVVATIVAARYVAESRAPASHRPDLAGFGTLTLSLVALVYGLIRASESGWGDRVVVTCLAVAGVLLAAFVLVERAVAHPMLDLRLLRIPTFVGGLVAAFAMNGSLFAMLLYVTLWLQSTLGYTALQTGVRLLLMSGLMMVTAAVSGRISARVPARWLIAPGLVLVGAGLLLMGRVSASSDWTHLVPGLVLGGIGGGLVNPPLASTAVGVVHHHHAGMASGASSTLRQIGLAVGIAAYGSIFSAALRDHARAGLHAAYAAGLNELFVVSGLVAVVGGLLSLALIRQQDFVAPATPGPSPEPEPEPATV